MPLSLLFCEGGPNSPDVRILGKLLAGRCEVRPGGSIHGMGDRIRAYREVLGGGQVAGVVDGDFRESWPTVRPLEEAEGWAGSDGETLGWRWSRKEIENYLLDPDVVSRALGERAPDPEAYQAQLDAAAEALVAYEAARTALSICRRRLRPMPTSWGPQRGRERHPFPDDISEAGCRSGLRSTVEEHSEGQAVTPDEVLKRYLDLSPKFAAGAPRRRDFLWTFAGKDLLWVMEAGLKELGLGSGRAFREQVLLGIEKTPDDISTWLPEWEALAAAVQAF